MKTIHSSRRHRYVARASIFLVVVALIAGMVGCGDEVPPREFRIQDWYDLDAVRDKLGANYVCILENDLDSTTPGYTELASPTANAGKGWEPIGAEGNAFKGEFDGNGNTISDLFIYRPDEDEVGLFGRVQEGIIENVGLVSVNVTGKKSVGALVGYSWKGTLDSDTRPPFSKTYSHGSVTGEEDVGGLVGNNYDGTVNQCESSADVLISIAPGEKRWRAGGLVGLNSGPVLNCNYNGEVNGDRQVGGLVGMNERTLTQVGRVEDCGGAYSVNGTSVVGGVVGLNLGALRRNSYAGKVNGILTVIGDGLTALNEDSTGNAHFSDTALPGSYVGGVVGWNEGTVEECSAEATVEGYQYVGGLAGANWGNVTGCNSSGDVTGDVDAGRLVGYNTGTVSNSESTSCLTGTSDCGPLVGRNEGVISEEEEEISIPFKNPGSFVQMTIRDVYSFDPAWSYDYASCEQVSYVYETLVYFDGTKTNEFVPVLATEWEFDSESVSYRFKIREGVKFHEGGDLTPEDIEYSFERAMVQDRHSGPSWMFYRALLGLHSSRDGDGIQVTFDEIDNVVEVDGDWVVFHLSDPSWGLAFLQILCSSWASIVDKEWCVTQGEWDGTEETWEDYNNPDKADSYLYNHTNGTGPWKLEEWDPGVQIKLVRNDAYWREPAAFERVITQVVEEWTTRKLALLAGDADFVYLRSPWAWPWAYSELEGIEELENIEDLNVYQDLPELSIDAFFFNFDKNQDSEYIGSGALDGNGIPTDFFTDIDVRKGFNYAFDWETYIADALMGEAEQRGSPVVEGLPFYNLDASMYSHDLTKAEEHLRAAWGGEVWEKGFNFTLVYNTGKVPREIACEILAENLLAINPKFQVSVQPIAYETYFGKIWGARDLPMFQIGWLPDYPHPDNFVVPFMASYGIFAELQSYGYPELDQLIEDAFKELDPAVQEDLYYELQERYYEDAPAIMLCQPLGRRYFTKYIEGFYFNPFVGVFGVPLYYMSKSSS